MKRKLLSLLVLLLTATTGAWAEVIYSGSCGTGVTYSLTDDGVLTISGSGAMTDYANVGSRPWNSDSYRNQITSVVIESGVTSIGSNAFYGCTNLASVGIFTSVTTIGNNAFEGCSSLTAIVVPASVTSIGANAFKSCSSLAKVNIFAYDPMTSCGDNAFDGASDGLKIYVPNFKGEDYETGWPAYASNIEELQACDYCGKPSVNGGKNVAWTLTKADVLTIIGTGAMADMVYVSSQPWYGARERIPSVVVEKGVTHIGNNSLRGLSKMTSLSLPEGLQTIGNYAFSSDNNESFTSVTIPASVTSIGTYAFQSCNGLTSITIPASVTNIGEYAFVNCSKLSTFTIPAGVTSIYRNTFAGCSSLGSIDIPAGVTSIGQNAFADCSSLGSIDIPAGVTSIGQYAFINCSELATVTLNSNPSIGTYAFYNIKAGASVTMNLTGHEGESGEYWMTFYNENCSFRVPSTTKIFMAELSGSTLILKELETDKIVNKNNAVILKSTSANITLDYQTTDGGNVFTYNQLAGVSDPAGKTAANPSTTFVLNKTATNGVGFYRLTSGKTLGVGKAYLTYSGSLAPEFFGFDDNTTGVNEVRGQMEDVRGEYYDLQGRRVAQPTKGLYIVNGKKVVIK